MASANALSAVREAPTGDHGLTQEAMSGWREGQRRCRARDRHNWGPYTVYEHNQKHGRYYEVVEQCSHCRNRRHADYIVTDCGLRKATKWHMEYRDGYLLPKGAMPLRLDDDLKDELVLGDIMSRKIIEVPDDDEDGNVHVLRGA